MYYVMIVTTNDMLSDFKQTLKSMMVERKTYNQTSKNTITS